MNSEPVSHRLGIRMGLLAFLSFNLVMGTMWGSFGVLLPAIEAKMGVGRGLSSLVAPLVMVGSALMAPVAGVLAGRMSLRLLLVIGSALGVAGFAILALSSNIQVTLITYALFLSPTVCLCGTVIPATLITRWYASNRGRVLGLVTLPILYSAAPLASAFVLRSHGLSAVYVMLAAIMAFNLVAQLFVVDYPPRVVDAAGEETAAAAGDSGLTIGDFIRQPRFWSVTIAYAVMAAGTVTISSHVAPMAIGWGIDPTKAAILLTVNGVAGMAGPLIFGWLADKIGGRIVMAILCIDCAVLWAVLLSQPTFPFLVVLVTLLGLHNAGSIPAYGVALSETFGQENFSRGYGLGNLAVLPFAVIMVPLAGSIYAQTGSYAGAVIIQAGLYVFTALFVGLVGGKLLLGRTDRVIAKPV